MDVFRFAWFAVRTFLGLIGLVLTLYGALWLYVKVDSTLRGSADLDAALRLVRSYDAQAGIQKREAQPRSPSGVSSPGSPGSRIGIPFPLGLRATTAAGRGTHPPAPGRNRPYAPRTIP